MPNPYLRRALREQQERRAQEFATPDVAMEAAESAFWSDPEPTESDNAPSDEE